MVQTKLNKREPIGIGQRDEDKQPSKPRILKPHQSVLKAYLREPIAETELTVFRDAMRNLLKRIAPMESEEFNKNLVAEFFNQSLYKDNMYMVNTRGRADLAIYSDLGLPVVLFEFKGPGRPDMITKEDLKQKALYELILYYIREEVKNHNTDIKHLIITNCHEYFIFDKKDFYQLFARNKRFTQSVLEAEACGEPNEYIYNYIIRPQVESIEDKLQFTYLNLQDFARNIDKDDILENRQFNNAYKLLSPVHLLKQSFNSDHNTLNTGFYQELLYIMGVEEVVENRVHKIKRLKTDSQSYSLVEQAYSKLEDYPRIVDESQRFETALGLVLTWINRILFLKLLESQLESFNNSGEIRFLNKQHIGDYDVLNDLFLKVLAKPVAERSLEMTDQFPNVPYLNSSLFELSQLEETFFPISGIRMGEMNLFAKTVLKDGRGKKISGRKNTLDYLLEFLEAYDFGSEYNADRSFVRQESKTLINASVLGLIFEKINGYKDGSFFTPGYITQYICQETLRKAVVDKFNATKGWECTSFEELKERIDYGKREVRTDANEIINSLKVCDPAVGSGHFLVSALNELIAIKSELGVLQDRQELPQRIRDYDVRVELDELVISNEDGENYKYDPSSPTSQRIQETLFEEKRTIIENCLFGVDLNPKSVEICRLRLWIELLKNAYYYKDSAGNRHLQTLPNIDINIKSGDSLLHRFDLKESISQVLQSTGITIAEYRNAVAEYKNAHSKKEKHHLAELITKIKTTLKTEIDKNDPKRKKLLGFKKQLSDLQMQELFSSNWTAKFLAEKRKKEKVLSGNIKKLEAYIADIESNKMYHNAFEWRIEFPEVLGNDGNFIGFDIVIGNPPYIQLQANGGKLWNLYSKANYSTCFATGDIYCLFYELGYNILKDNGILSFINSNSWLQSLTFSPFRKFVTSNFGWYRILITEKMFNAVVDTHCVQFIKTFQQSDCEIFRLDNQEIVFSHSVDKQRITKTEECVNIVSNDEQISINYKIFSNSQSLSELFTVFNGVKPFEKGKGIPPQTYEIVKNKPYVKEGIKPDDSWTPLLRGSLINKYVINWDNNYWIQYGPWLAAPRQKEIFDVKKKIVIRQTGDSIIAAIIDDSYICRNNLHICIAIDTTNIEYVLGLLNSKLMKYAYSYINPEKGEALAEVKKAHVEKLPIKIDITYKEHISALVKDVMTQVKFGNNCEHLLNQIDRLVYHIYDLTYDEVKIIDPDTSITREEYVE